MTTPNTTTETTEISCDEAAFIVRANIARFTGDWDAEGFTASDLEAAEAIHRSHEALGIDCPCFGGCVE